MENRTDTGNPAQTLSVTVDAARTRQRLDGFGASTAFYQNWIAAHPNKRAIYDALFRGLGLDILRLQNSWRPGNGWGWADHDADIVKGARAALERPVTVMLSSWSPPAPLKSNGREKDGGTLASEGGAFAYRKFADHWVESVARYRQAGIDPAYVSIQNEPDWKDTWETCLLKPTEQAAGGEAYAGYDRALAAVSDRFRAIPGSPKLVGPEPLGLGGNSLQNYLPPRNTFQISRLYAVAHHLYSGGTHADPDGFAPALRAVRAAYPDKPKWMTEMGRGDGLQTAGLIHACLTEEDASAYLYWAAVWPGDDCLISIDNPWKRGEWRRPGGFSLNDRYYAVKHYSYFTAPGYRRVEVSPPGDRAIKVSAFVAPDRSRLVVVALNASGGGRRDVALAVRGFAPGAARAYRTTFPSPGAVGERFASVGAPAPGGRVTLPPRSLVTVVFSRSGNDR